MVETLARTHRVMLRRSIFVLIMPLIIIAVVLACAGTKLLDVPTYVCPTAIPATGTPAAPATPYVIVPPQDFYVGDAVFVGGAGSPTRVRFRLLNVQTFPTAPKDGQPRNIYAWQLEVKNVGTADYNIFPAYQMYLSEVTTAVGDIEGAWGSGQAAAIEAGLISDNGIYVLAPVTVRTFRFAAYAPAGSARRFTFTLDPNVTDGSGKITWANQSNPFCIGDVAD